MLARLALSRRNREGRQACASTPFSDSGVWIAEKRQVPPPPAPPHLPPYFYEIRKFQLASRSGRIFFSFF